MTEEEAKQKWCPHVQFVSHPAYEDVFTNRNGSNELNCIGSECMAWREEFPHSAETSVPCGYCGRAGKP